MNPVPNQHAVSAGVFGAGKINLNTPKAGNPPGLFFILKHQIPHTQYDIRNMPAPAISLLPSSLFINCWGHSRAGSESIFFGGKCGFGYYNSWHMPHKRVFDNYFNHFMLDYKPM